MEKAVSNMVPGRAKPLAGFRVLDFTTMVAGPYCSRLLADCGAEVLKIEEPSGDHMRNARPLRNGQSAYFAALNCGKKSLSIDLKSERGRAAAADLAACSDVVLENFRPGVMKRLGLDYSELARRRPELVYCSISGFGQSGPRASQAAYAPVIHAASGFDHTHAVYQDGDRRPARTGIFTADYLAAVYAFGAIQTALIGRLRQGYGQHIDLALMDSMMSLLVYEYEAVQFPSDTPRPLFGPLATQDGFVNVAIVNQRNFEQLADVSGNSRWKSDPRFSTPHARPANWKALMEEVEVWTRRHSARQCEEILMAAGVACSRYQTVAEAMADPQVVVRGSWSEAEDGAGRLKVLNPPFRFGDGSVGAGGKVPSLGEHTREVLETLLSLETADVDALVTT
jgi:crotonobetainyl-CoA:carnitine CoA-transferase CaiB-like acyl-CoA transferase